MANCIGKHDTGSQAVMNCATYEDRRGKKTLFIAGKDNYSALYSISKRFEKARSVSYSDQNENCKNIFIISFTMLESLSCFESLQLIKALETQQEKGNLPPKTIKRMERLLIQ